MFLKVEGLTAHYGHVKALDGVSMEAEKGSIVTLIGANGAGKIGRAQAHIGNDRVRRASYRAGIAGAYRLPGAFPVPGGAQGVAENDCSGKP